MAHKCAQVPEVFSEIVLASRNEEKCRRIAAQIARPIATAQVDANDVAAMAALIRRESPELVINVALPYQDLPIMDACTRKACARAGSATVPRIRSRKAWRALSSFASSTSLLRMVWACTCSTQTVRRWRS